MFTICFAVFASLTSTTAADEHCERATRNDLAAHIAQCKADDRDPVGMCEARPAGALMWFVTRRSI